MKKIILSVCMILVLTSCGEKTPDKTEKTIVPKKTTKEVQVENPKKEEEKALTVMDEYQALAEKSPELEQCVQNTVTNCLQDAYLQSGVTKKDKAFCDKLLDPVKKKFCEEALTGNVAKLDLEVVECEKENDSAKKQACKNAEYTLRARARVDASYCAHIKSTKLVDGKRAVDEVGKKNCENNVFYLQAAVGNDARYCEKIHTDVGGRLKTMCLEFVKK